MRFWILLLTITVVLMGIFEESDLLGDVSFNPLGHWVEPKVDTDIDLFREQILIENTNEPDWEKVNYGSLDQFRTNSTDANGTAQTAIGDAEPIANMLENSLNDSKVPPAPSGMTINVLPGMQPSKTVLNSFVFSVTGGGSILAPRKYYMEEHKLIITYTDDGVVKNNTAPTGVKTVDVVVMQVPFSEDHFITDTTGMVTEASKVEGVNRSIMESLNALDTLVDKKSTPAQLTSHFFDDSGKLTTSYTNINEMINKSAYSDSYNQGLGIALGTGTDGKRDLRKGSLHTSTVKDVYQQFDFIYESMSKRKGSGYFAPDLVDWAQNNALAITNTLMVNYMIQSQFKSSGSGNYKTPINQEYWGKISPTSEEKAFKKRVNEIGSQSKEPFYLYTSLKPTLTLQSNGLLPTLKDEDIQPHLGYIYNLFMGVQAGVWQAKTNVTGTHKMYDTPTKEMRSDVKKVRDDIEAKTGMNQGTFKIEEIENNNLVSGLSSSKFRSSNFTNEPIVAALRLALSRGEKQNTNIVLNGIEYKYTSLDANHYTKKYKYGHMYNNFVSSGGDMYKRWIASIQSVKNAPIRPAIFRSNWSGGDSAGAYIALPVLIGGKDFTAAIRKMAFGKEDTGTDTIASPGEDRDSFLNMSKANRYVMAFNLTPDSKSVSKRENGVARVDTGAPMGKAKHSNKPIVITGYLGGESFSIVDYFKVQDAIAEGRDKPTLTVTDNNNKVIKLDYFNMFEDFFTIRSIDMFTGTQQEPKFIEGFDKQGYIDQYNANKSKSMIKHMSPDYTKLFEKGVETNEQED